MFSFLNLQRKSFLKTPISTGSRNISNRVKNTSRRGEPWQRQEIIQENSNRVEEQSEGKTKQTLFHKKKEESVKKLTSQLMKDCISCLWNVFQLIIYLLVKYWFFLYNWCAFDHRIPLSRHSKVVALWKYETLSYFHFDFFLIFKG